MTPQQWADQERTGISGSFKKLGTRTTIYPYFAAAAQGTGVGVRRRVVEDG